MSGVCDPTQQIGTYQPSSGSSTIDAISTKNIDLVSLTAQTVNTYNFTVDGEDVITKVQAAISATENETSTPDNTSFSGTVNTDGLTSPTTFQFNSSVIATASPSLDGSTTVNGVIQLNNSSSTTLSNFLYQTTAPTPSSYTAQVNWYLGKANSSNSMLVLSFKNTGLGSTSNYLSISPQFSTGLNIYPTNIQASNLLQVNGITVPPKTLSTIQACTASSTNYTFSLTSVTNMKRIVIMGVDILKTNNVTPLIQVGQGTTFYANNPGCYVGVTKGNNGAAQISFAASGMYLWNATTGAPLANGLFDFVVELQYLHSDPGYQVWSVQGSTATTSNATFYINWLSGTVNMNSGPYPNLTSVRVVFGTGNGASSGYINVLAF
jgi:hypothetical protein